MKRMPGYINCFLDMMERSQHCKQSNYYSYGCASSRISSKLTSYMENQISGTVVYLAKMMQQVVPCRFIYLIDQCSM